MPIFLKRQCDRTPRAPRGRADRARAHHAERVLVAGAAVVVDDTDLGFDRIVASETEAPNNYFSLVLKWLSGGTKRQCDRTLSQHRRNADLLHERGERDRAEVLEALRLERRGERLRRRVDLGSGRIVASEIEAPKTLANMVQNG